MKIAIIGTHGVGKTTLVNEFSRRHAEYITIPEMAREIIEEKGRDIPSLHDFEIEVLWRKLEAERVLATYPHIISDRTTIDAWAYCRYYGAFPRKMLDILRELCIAHSVAYYDLIVYLPPEALTPQGDQFAGPHEPVDAIIRETLPRLPRKATLRGTLEERVKKLETMVSLASTPAEGKPNMIALPG